MAIAAESSGSTAFYWYWDRSLRVCARCLHDESIAGITFDDDGICSYCDAIAAMEHEYPTGDAGRDRLHSIAAEIKHAGRGKKYDCVVGVSGGCDSSFLLYQMKELGLRPLAAHFDNTWNSTIATANIRNVLNELDVDLFTIVVDNEEYDDMYRAFFRAGVPDLEAPTDIGLATTLYRAAEKYGINYMIEGHSFRTEGVAPLGWLYMDGKYIASVHRRHGQMKMKTFPNLWLRLFLKWMLFGRIKKIRPLYYLDYHKEDTKRLLAKKFGWQWYGGHHLENRFTAFFHLYFLPRRFRFDTRLNGFSALVRSSQMTREEGFALMAEPPHADPELVDYVKRRLGFSDDEFEHLMTMPKKTYRDYPTYKPLFERLRPFFYLMYRADLVPKSFYMKYTAPDPISAPATNPVSSAALANPVAPRVA